METISNLPNEKSNAIKTIVVAGLVAGVLDMIAACAANYWLSPLTVFQSVAAGIYGGAAYQGGVKTAVLGIFLHFVIAFGAAAVFYFAGRRISFLTNQWLVSGAIYGVAVYWFMQLVVLPLSNFPSKNDFEFLSNLKGILIHIFCIGLPIAFITRRFSK